MLLSLFGLEHLFDAPLNLRSPHPFFAISSVVLLLPLVLFLAPTLSTWLEWQIYWYRSRVSGLRKIGISDTHVDQTDAVVNDGQDPVKVVGKIDSLVLYPIKSCGYIKVNHAPVVEEGLLFDRLFCFAQLEHNIDASSKAASTRWRFITQRNLSKMANVKVEIWLPCSYRNATQSTNGILLLRFPSASSTRPPWLVRLPLFPKTEKIPDGEGMLLEPVSIWMDSPPALKIVSTETPSPPSWIVALRQYLGVSNHLGLFYLPQSHLRKVFRNAPNQTEHGWQPKVGFGDSYPIHIVNIASVCDLEQDIRERNGKADSAKNTGSHPALDLTLNFLQFRPNIIINGPQAYAEDNWKRITIGKSEFIVTNRTARCPLPNVDQDTGERHSHEPLTTMTKTRCIDKGAAGTPCFGMMMVPVARRSFVEVGGLIEVLQTGEHLYVRL